MKNSPRLLTKVIVLFIIAALSINFYFINKFLLVIWLIALSIGFILYRSGICFSGAFIDIILFRNYTMLRATLLIIMVSLLGISLIQYFNFSKGLAVPGFIGSVGVSTAVGGFMFGVGMVFAGACGCGTLQRIGEGFSLYLWVLVSLMIGAVIGAYHFSWWTNTFVNFNPVYLPNIFGWPWGVLVSLTALGSFYVLTIIAEKGFFSYQRGSEKWQKKG